MAQKETEALIERPINLGEESSIQEDDSKKKDSKSSGDRIIPYKMYEAQSLKDGEEPLSKVCGLDDEKKELLNVVSWFKNSKELRDKGISIPRGVILYGEPGNGKSLLMKEIIRCAEAPVFVFEGGCDDIPSGINEVFRKAREAKHSIIVFDELDLLIDKDNRTIRALQENLDGVESYDDILVLAATNNINNIPDPILRHGRLEKKIEIPYPEAESSVALLKKHFNEFNVTLPEDFDDDEFGLSLNGITCAGIKAVVNDVVLRNGFKDITCDMIEQSINNIDERTRKTDKANHYDIAVHEAGHAVMAHAFKDYFTIGRLNIYNTGGMLMAKEVEEKFWPYEKVIAGIKIAMAGVIAQKVVCKTGTRGAESDMNKARLYAYNLVNCNGFNRCFETLPEPGPYHRQASQIKLRHNERVIERLLKECEHKVFRYIRKHTETIEKLANELLLKKRLKSSEILSIIG